MEAAGEMMIIQLENTVKYAANQDWDNETKFRYVWDEMRKSYAPKTISDNYLNILIEVILAVLKKKGIVQ
jgi:hypothetical protein